MPEMEHETKDTEYELDVDVIINEFKTKNGIGGLSQMTYSKIEFLINSYLKLRSKLEWLEDEQKRN